MRNRIGLALPQAMLLVGLGSACSSVAPDGAPVPGRSWGDTARPAAAAHGGAEAPIDEFLARAGAGDATLVTSADGRGTLLISVENDYHAASGRTCRRLVVTAGDERPTPRVACRDRLGVWRLLPLLRNRGLPGVNSHSEAGTGRAS